MAPPPVDTPVSELSAALEALPGGDERASYVSGSRLYVRSDRGLRRVIWLSCTIVFGAPAVLIPLDAVVLPWAKWLLAPPLAAIALWSLRGALEAFFWADARHSHRLDFERWEATFYGPRDGQIRLRLPLGELHLAAWREDDGEGVATYRAALSPAFPTGWLQAGDRRGVELLGICATWDAGGWQRVVRALRAIGGWKSVSVEPQPHP